MPDQKQTDLKQTEGGVSLPHELRIEADHVASMAQMVRDPYFQEQAEPETIQAINSYVAGYNAKVAKAQAGNSAARK